MSVLRLLCCGAHARHLLHHALKGAAFVLEDFSDMCMDTGQHSDGCVQVELTCARVYLVRKHPGLLDSC
eukprot:493653-Pelagomonas_calceolata.AAC.1